MEAKTIILRLDNNYIYLNEVIKLGYEKTNLPKQYFQFKTERSIYFEVKQLSFADTGTLKVSVINYASTEYNTFLKQKPISSINRIELEKMEWTKFSPLLFSYKPNMIRDSFSDLRDIELESTDRDNKYFFLKAPNLFAQVSRTPLIENIQCESKVKFEEATFYDGGIKFTAKIKVNKHKLTEEISIENLRIKKEFQNITTWFVKKIGKSFITTISIRLVDNLIKEINATSKDISLINEELIESIKTEQVLKLVKIARLKKDGKSVFNNDELFSILDESNNFNVFNTATDNILEIIIKNGLAKNVKQLNYLTSNKQSLKEKLRFTIKPHFGFVFKVETTSKIFFIWELLNSHATYVWEIAKHMPQHDQFIEKQISFVLVKGREPYKRYYKDLTSKDFSFYLIEHAAKDLTEEERFQIWKKRVEIITRTN
jgi:hypothetical protein